MKKDVVVRPRLLTKDRREQGRTIMTLKFLWQLTAAGRTQLDPFTWIKEGGLDAEEFLECVESGRWHPLLRRWHVMKGTSGANTTRTATVMKANDQPEGPLVSFELEPFDFGLDEDDEPFHTFILSKDIIAAVPAKSSLSDQQRLALEALAETVLASGRDAPAEYGLPHGTKIVTADQWKTELFRLNVLDPKASNPRSRFNELRKRLRVKHLIGVRDDLIWNAYPEKQP